MFWWCNHQFMLYAFSGRELHIQTKQVFFLRCFSSTIHQFVPSCIALSSIPTVLPVSVFTKLCLISSFQDRNQRRKDSSSIPHPVLRKDHHIYPKTKTLKCLYVCLYEWRIPELCWMQVKYHKYVVCKYNSRSMHTLCIWTQNLEEKKSMIAVNKLLKHN